MEYQTKKRFHQRIVFHHSNSDAICRLLICGFLLIHIQNVSGYAYYGATSSDGIVVSNANHSSRINGIYYRASSLLCYNTQVYIQDSSSQYFLSVIKDYINGTDVNYWAIGTTLCVIPQNITAYNRMSGSIVKPYEVTNPWFEFDPKIGTFVENPYIAVTYFNNALSAGEILGILLGCFCFGIFVFIVVAFFFHKFDPNKRRRTEPTSYENADYFEERRRAREARRQAHSAASSSTTDPIYAVPIEPPAYDNQPPPSYDLVEVEKQIEEQTNMPAPPYCLHDTMIDSNIPQEGGVSNDSRQQMSQDLSNTEHEGGVAQPDASLNTNQSGDPIHLNSPPNRAYSTRTIENSEEDLARPFTEQVEGVTSMSTGAAANTDKSIPGSSNNEMLREHENHEGDINQNSARIEALRYNVAQQSNNNTSQYTSSAPQYLPQYTSRGAGAVNEAYLEDTSL